MGFKWGMCCYLFAKMVIGMKLNPIEIGNTIALVAPASWSDRVEETRSALIDRGF